MANWRWLEANHRWLKIARGAKMWKNMCCYGTLSKRLHLKGRFLFIQTWWAQKSKVYLEMVRCRYIYMILNYGAILAIYTSMLLLCRHLKATWRNSPGNLNLTHQEKYKKCMLLVCLRNGDYFRQNIYIYSWILIHVNVVWQSTLPQWSNLYWRILSNDAILTVSFIRPQPCVTS